MLSTVVSRLIVAPALALSISLSTPTSYAAQPEAKLVARLYQDYGWEAIASQPDLFGEGLLGANKVQLERYFTPQLAQMLFVDSVCQKRSHEICNLDFDVLFDSQDPRVSDLSIERLAPGTVRVQFNDPVTNKKTLIEYQLALIMGKWRIADVIYQKHPHESLKQVLSRPPPKH